MWKRRKQKSQEAFFHIINFIMLVRTDGSPCTNGCMDAGWMLGHVWRNEQLLFWFFACCGHFQSSELFLLARMSWTALTTTTTVNTAPTSRMLIILFIASFALRFTSQFLMAVRWCDDFLHFDHMEYGNEKRESDLCWRVRSQMCAVVSPERASVISEEQRERLKFSLGFFIRLSVCLDIITLPSRQFSLSYRYFDFHRMRHSMGCDSSEMMNPNSECLRTIRKIKLFLAVDLTSDPNSFHILDWVSCCRCGGRARECAFTWLLRNAFHPKVFDWLTMGSEIVRWTVHRILSLRLVGSRLNDFVID